MTIGKTAGPVLSDLAAEEAIVRSLRGRSGQATLGDVCVDTGLPRHSGHAHMQRLLSLYESHLSVDDEGELLYTFDKRFVRRDTGDGLRRGVRTALIWAWKAFKFLFKISIMVTLVAYFVFFIVLLIAAMVAVFSRGGSSSSDSRRSPVTPIFWIGRVFWVPDDNRRRGSGTSRRRRSEPQEKKEPFYKRIFAYVFGPEAASDKAKDPFGDEKRILEFIRANKGVVTASELAAHTGFTRADADSRLAGLMYRHEGDVRVTRNGTLLYLFEATAKSASMARPAASHAWDNFEPKQTLTGNTPGINFAITFFNAFNLVMSVFAGSLLSYVLEQPLDLWVHFVVGVFPFLFSVVFFAVPLLRLLWLVSENASRAVRNSWRFVQREVYSMARGGRDVTSDSLVEAVSRNWPAAAPGKARPTRIAWQLEEAVVDYDAEVGDYTGGSHTYRFETLRHELEDAHRARRLVLADQLTLGKIVFSSADDDLGLDRLEEFDEQLSGAGSEVSAEALAEANPELEEFDQALAQATAEQESGR